MTTENPQTMEIKKGPAEAAPEQSFVPLVDIYEQADGTNVIEAEVPGATSDGIEIKVDKGVLTLTADAMLPVPGEEFTTTYEGFQAGQYYRAFALSDEIDRDKIEAKLANGVLTLSLPKAAAAKTRKIPISTD